MIRNALALLLVGVAVALFVFVVGQSRPISTRQLEEHREILTLLDGAVSGYQSLVEGFADARQVGQPVSDRSRQTLQELETSAARLEELVASEQSERAVAVRALAGSTAALLDASRRFITHQDALGKALENIRESSPTLVQELRQSGDRMMSHNTFALVTRVLDYARVHTSVQPQELATRLDRLSREQQNANATLAALLYSVRTVLEERPQVEHTWNRVIEPDFLDAARGVSLAQESLHTTRLVRIERYRLLLSVYSALLLLALAFLGFRLYQSYRVLNKTNAELEELNQNLESRVRSRTEELQSAYESLKESQVQLVQAAKMSSLGQLVAGISHEINTPLLYLRNNATLIKERLESLTGFVDCVQEAISLVRGAQTDKEKFMAALRTVHRQLRDGIVEDIGDSSALIIDSIDGLEQLSEMALSLKDFSRLDRAPVAKFNVNDGLDKTLLIARNMLKNRVTIHKQYGELPEITCSPSQINQVFLNLITNAAQAIERTGDVVIRTRHDGEFVRITVSDTGCGIPPEIMAKIRDPFFTTKEVGKGTGLGLSIVDKIIETHGGQLEIKSEVGKGSAFTVALPIESRITVEASGESAALAEAAAQLRDETMSLKALAEPVDEDEGFNEIFADVGADDGGTDDRADGDRMMAAG